MIYVTGDCHGDWRRFSSKSFPQQSEMTREDFVIVCGDFGIWHDSPAERYWLDWLSNKNFTLCFVDGNHENFDRLNGEEFKEVFFHGGKAHKIRDNIYHLKRGYIFTLCGKNIFTFGGAHSHDISDGVLDGKDFASTTDFMHEIKKWQSQNKMFRVNHVSWWQEEVPSREEMSLGIDNLKDINNKVDFIITHTCPNEILSQAFPTYCPDDIGRYLDYIYNNVKFEHWYCGHYHEDVTDDTEFSFLYRQIVKIL